MSDHEMKKSLISAYCDGELNAVELAQVEKLLAASATARAELEAYRQMSQLVKNARPQVQVNLKSGVLQAIRSQNPATAKRSTAAAANSTVVAGSQGQRDSASRAPTGHRSWALVAASVAAVAFVFWAGVKRGGNDELAQNTDPQKSGLEVTSKSQTGTLEAGEPDAANADKSAITKTDVNSNGTNISAPPTPDTKSVAATNVVSPPLDASQLPVELIADLKNSNVGQIQKFIRQNKDGVTVFHLMVVDITPGMESLEMILSAQKISTVDGKPTNDRADVVAVYVEAEQNKMDRLVEQIKDEHEKFLALAVQRDAMPKEQMASLNMKKASRESQAVPVDASQLKNVGVSPLKSEQIKLEMARNRTGRRGSREVGRPLALKPAGAKDESPMLKLLIVIEKATPESLLNQPAIQRN